jgi:hypothetical protein
MSREWFTYLYLCYFHLLLVYLSSLCQQLQATHISSIFPTSFFPFYRILGAGDSVSFDTSFWNEKIETEKKTEYKYTNNEKGREMVTAAVFLLGELSMVGFSLDEDEGTAATVKKNLNSKLPSFSISDISKSFKIIIPKKVILLTQILMSTHLPVQNEGESLSQTYGNLPFTQNHEFENNGKECPSVIRAHAFVTMGKICLRDKNMARNHINVYLRELHKTNKKGI